MTHCYTPMTAVNITNAFASATDYKAEALCSELLWSGLSFDQLTIQYAGDFKKGYRNDVEQVQPADSDKSDNLEIILNRNGIYDRIPEGVFHQSLGTRRTEQVKDMVDEYRRFREEEKHARKFFQPLEQEIFRFATLVETQEQKYVLSLLADKPNKQLFDFWNIPRDLPMEKAHILASLLPASKLIVGDMELTGSALSLVLSKPVRVEQFVACNHQLPYSQETMQCDNWELGVNTMIGQKFQEPSVGWKFIIEDVTRKEVVSFSPGNSYDKLLRVFAEYFVPVILDVQYELELETVNDYSHEEVLGYSTIL